MGLKKKKGFSRAGCKGTCVPQENGGKETEKEEMSFIKKFGGGRKGAKLVTVEGWVIGEEVKICTYCTF